MKKLFVAFAILLFITAGLFAEDNLFSFGLNSVWDPFYLRSFTGSFAKEGVLTDRAPDPFPYQGGNEIQSFRSSVFGSGNDAWVRFNYNTERFGARVQLTAYGMENIDFHLSNWNAWIRVGAWFDDNLSVRLLAGTTGQDSSIPSYQNFAAPLQFRKDAMGVMVPINNMTDMFSNADNLPETVFPYGYGLTNIPTGYVNFASINVANLFVPAGSVVLDKYGNAFEQEASGFLVDIETKPVTVSLSLGGLMESLARPFSVPWPHLWRNAARRNYAERMYDSNSEHLLEDVTFTIGARAETKRFSDMWMMSALYKYTEMRLTKKETPYPDSVGSFTVDSKNQSHEFGLYANAVLPFNLGVTIGYSGMMRRWISDNYTFMETLGVNGYDDVMRYWFTSWKRVDFPFFNGIDLRMEYTGIERFVITFNNNITFARVNGYTEREDGEPVLYRTSWTYEDRIFNNPDRSERYTGLNNVLGFTFEATDALKLHVHVSNQFGIFNLVNNNDSERIAHSMVNCFGFYAGANFDMMVRESFKLGFRGGVSFANRTFNYQSPDNSERFKAGWIDLGFPIGISLQY
ncbi:MAG: hypothetical protein FWG89_03285 [Treponema sp.]|nr:hypothetical protein [Treponema sp.]